MTPWVCEVDFVWLHIKKKLNHHVILRHNTNAVNNRNWPKVKYTTRKLKKTSVLSAMLKSIVSWLIANLHIKNAQFWPKCQFPVTSDTLSNIYNWYFAQIQTLIFFMSLLFTNTVKWPHINIRWPDINTYPAINMPWNQHNIQLDINMTRGLISTQHTCWYQHNTPFDVHITPSDVNNKKHTWDVINNIMTLSIEVDDVIAI